MSVGRLVSVIIMLLIALSIIAYTIYIIVSPQEGIGGRHTIVANVTHGGEIFLPLPRKVTTMTVEEAILLRRSLREYKDEPLTIEQLSMILWVAQGITETRWRFRAAPSAGATYPLEVYVVIGERGVRVNGEFLKAGVYKYNVLRHSLILVKEGDVRSELYRASLEQEWVREAPIDLVICAVYERTTRVYGERGYRYVYMEVGHVGQNVYLMATALGLGTVVIGAFHDDWVAKIINAESNEHPLYIIPVGVPVHPYRFSFEELGKWYDSMRSK